MGLLSLAIWMPIAFGVLLLVSGRDEQARSVRWIALIGAVASFLVTLPLYDGFKLGTAAMQFVEKTPWIERFALVCPADRIYQRRCCDCWLGSHYPPRESVHGRVPDLEWAHDRCFLRAGWPVVLCLF